MNITEAAVLLTIAATFDHRTVSQSDAQAWQAVLADVDLDDARAAVVEHYRTSTERLMPAHVVAGVRRLRADRLARGVDEVPDADPDDLDGYRAALREGRYRRASGSLSLPAGALTTKAVPGR